MAVLKQIKFGTSTTPIAKTVVNGTGVVSVTNTKDFSNEKTEDKDYSYDIDVNVDDSTIIKSENKLAVGNVPAAHVTVADEDGVFTAGNVETALKELKDNIASVDGKAKSYTIVKETTGLETNVKEQYKLQETVGKESNFVGEPINIYKDSSLKSVELVGQTLNFTYIFADGSESTVGVDVSTFLAESEFADGLQVTDHVVSVKLGQGLEFGDEAKNKSIKVKIDSTSESFLTVGKEGVKLAGVQNAIDAKVAALDVTDAAVEGQVVTAVSTADGIAQPTKANFAGIKLGGFAQDADVTGEIASTDTLAAALNKLENKIDAAADDHTVVKHADSNTHVIVSSTLNGNGSMTYTVTENDIASAQALTEEIGRAQKAEKEIADKVGLTGAEGSRTFAPTQNYGTGSTSVVDNMQKLDTQLKKVTDDLAAVQYKVSGTTLEFYGMTEHA